MVRIDTRNANERWRYACPTPARHVDWRVVDGEFHCQSCDEYFDELVNRETRERVARDEIELVGPHADSKGAFGKRPEV